MKQRLTLSKSKSLESEEKYFVVVRRAHLLFELACPEERKRKRKEERIHVKTVLKKGRRHVGIWSTVYTTCYRKGCEVNNSEMLLKFKARLTFEIKLS